jgi:hypothetical protein
VVEGPDRNGGQSGPSAGVPPTRIRTQQSLKRWGRAEGNLKRSFPSWRIMTPAERAERRAAVARGDQSRRSIAIRKTRRRPGAGRGLQPYWVRDALKSGKKLDASS